MGRGGTPYVQAVPREDNLDGARVKMLRPRRVYVGADLERLYATSIGHHCSHHFGKGRCGTRSPRSNAAASDPNRLSRPGPPPGDRRWYSRIALGGNLVEPFAQCRRSLTLSSSSSATFGSTTIEHPVW
jgi:hypothetical protein